MRRIGVLMLPCVPTRKQVGPTSAHICLHLLTAKDANLTFDRMINAAYRHSLHMPCMESGVSLWKGTGDQM